ncbi:hypothetical protein GCM10012285_41390 [Streptomyces kronopolitis]|uniref:Uncharacterized protein n=1 Tax=Streptomyces kronopolitis TaxID=1612435 RepID=A0ABQ2JM68_9ACTN|nr:hypothetical protein [Streptomyces kronopolitis]GGN51356.1 hypothetical protein GCM10012285_41390 [Streptomyces kronopolitis]
MPDATALDQATAMIEKAWGHPIDALEALAVRSPCADPLLRSAMHTRTALNVTDHAVSVHQDRLHALTRLGTYRASTKKTRSPERRSTSAWPRRRAVRICRRSSA